MGGAGAAMPIESLGALTFNPALLAGAEGNQVSFATEFFKERIVIDTTLGPLKGTATADSQIGVLPAFGWMLRAPKGKLALGFGLIGISSMGADYPADNASVLFAAVPNGFGRIFTDYRETKIPVAFAYQVTPKLAIGASLNIYLGSFAAAPLPGLDFDVSFSGKRYYPSAGRLTDSWAFAGQFGFHYQASPKVSIGGSITTPQNFAPYKWNATYSNPEALNFGQARTVKFDLDGPMIASFGVGFKPDAKTRIAIDGMFTKYKGVHGLGGPGGIVNGVIDPFGWRDIWTIKAGVEHQATEKLTVRAGYNYSQMPVRSGVVISATGAPVTFQQYICGGFGLRMFPFLEMVASVYVIPRAHVAGPFPDLQGVVRGTLDESNARTSGLIGMNFRF
jgi:long-chain fatty acid transport protein